MTNLVSIVTPVAPYHTDLLPRAVESVDAQTVECTHIVIHDEEGRGTGWARNKGLEAVDTPFVVWLDADDWIEPDFAERCLRAYDGTRYVYTDWFISDTVREAPDCAMVNGRAHIVTTLLPTAWARAIGGFDETLIFAEDTYFYVKLHAMGLCGKRLPVPLFHYGDGGQRGRRYVNTPVHYALIARTIQEFGEERIMGCCGPSQPVDNSPMGVPQEGDLLVMALWGGNRTVFGKMTGRTYPRTSYPKTLWVNWRDAEAMPNMFRRADAAPPMPVPAPPPVNLQSAHLHGAAQVAAALAGNGRQSVVAMQTETPAYAERSSDVIEGGDPQPDTRKIVSKGRKARSR
jgi:hypothetical protein